VCCWTMLISAIGTFLPKYCEQSAMMPVDAVVCQSSLELMHSWRRN
jgi:hypothetical protein